MLGLTYGRSKEKVFLGTFFSFAGALIAEEYARLAPPENACCSLTLSRRAENQYGHSFEEDDSPGDCRASLYARRLLHSLAPSLAASPEARPLLLHLARSNEGGWGRESRRWQWGGLISYKLCPLLDINCYELTIMNLLNDLIDSPGRNTS